VTRAAAALALVLALPSCAENPLLALHEPERPLPVPPEPLAETYDSVEGSLWRGEDSRRFLSFENRAKRIGDLVTVEIEERSAAESEASTELDRESAFDVNVNSAVALQTLITRPILRFLNFFGFTDRRTDGNPQGNVQVVSARTQSSFEGDGKLEREARFITTVACVVTEISPAGLLRVEGERHLTINRETQVIALAGWVRPEDIRIDNTVPSRLVASADIQYGGRGALSAKQRDPWLVRIFEVLLPF
jgi:flagellar L-ring protein precursor FlgH